MKSAVAKLCSFRNLFFGSKTIGHFIFFSEIIRHTENHITLENEVSEAVKNWLSLINFNRFELMGSRTDYCRCSGVNTFSAEFNKKIIRLVVGVVFYFVGVNVYNYILTLFKCSFDGVFGSCHINCIYF